MLKLKVQSKLATWLNPNVNIGIRLRGLSEKIKFKPRSLLQTCVNCCWLITFLQVNRFGVIIFRLINLLSISIASTRMGRTSYDIFNGVFIKRQNLLNDRTNMMITSFFRNSANVSTIWIGLSLNLPLLLSSLDLLWFHLPFIENTTIIKEQRIELIKAKLILALSYGAEYSFRIAIKLIYPTFSTNPDSLIFTFSYYNSNYVKLYRIYLTYILQVINIFVSSGFNYIAKQLESVDQKTNNLGEPKLFTVFTYNGSIWLQDYRKSFELLSEMIHVINTTFSSYLFISYFTVIPIGITVIYDIMFSQMEFKLYHVADITIYFIHIQILNYYLSLSAQNSEKIWNSLYRLTLISKNDSLQSEVSVDFVSLSNFCQNRNWLLL